MWTASGLRAFDEQVAAFLNPTRIELTKSSFREFPKVYRSALIVLIIVGEHRSSLRFPMGAALLIGVTLLLLRQLAAAGDAGSLMAADGESGFEVWIEAAEQVKPGEIVDIDLYVGWRNSSCTTFTGGFELALAFDSTTMTPFDVLPVEAPAGCTWKPFRYEHSFPVDNGYRLPVLRLKVDMEPDCLHDTCRCLWPDGRICRLRFQTHGIAALYSTTSSLEFCWEQCTDNVLRSADGDTAFLAGQVFDAAGVDITDDGMALPSLAGPHADCDDSLLICYKQALRNVIFRSTVVTFRPWEPSGVAGDINGDGSGFELDDFNILRGFFLYGDSVFNLSRDAQIAQTDFDGDGLNAGLADLVTMRYIMNGSPSGNPPTETPHAGFIYESTPNLLTVSIRADSPIGAYNLWFAREKFEVNYVEFHGDEDAGELGGRYYYRVSDSLRVLFLGGSPQVPVLNAGLHKLFTISYGGNEPLPMAERAVTSEGIVFQKEVPTNVIAETAAEPGLPTATLRQNYPNPFNPSTTIHFTVYGSQFTVHSPIHSTLRIHNIL
ncbi:MAG: hypothetical protein KAW91_05715, partial [candidate division Zixibacteria bacterium]|nr:hypothetical protein [candidate division Zixibacteria bacterium]